MTTKEFGIKYKKLFTRESLQLHKVTTYTIENFSEVELSQFPDLLRDIEFLKAYEAISNKNMFKRYSLKPVAVPKKVKPLLLKTDDIRIACDKYDPNLNTDHNDFRMERDLLNVVIEICNTCQVIEVTKHTEDAVDHFINFRFLNAIQKQGYYSLPLYGQSTGFQKLAVKHITEAHETYKLL